MSPACDARLRGRCGHEADTSQWLAQHPTIAIPRGSRLDAPP
ncbi:hypothetical protein DB31_5749 [Hyalangium minutum]|uniref:Uncharacterized protein n=1 Tax=Hyalangium minutum TaxID=394096 RepID=A0A085WSP4_9BACT|nr:hypothetical protein DB31_5749 [Hyalangium minutum]